MSRILFIWELGSGYGHLETFPDLALSLRERGHQVVFAIRDLRAAEQTLGIHGFTCLQAPIWVSPKLAGRSSPSFSEIFRNHGYENSLEVLGHVKAWRELYRLVAPDLLLFNYSPTALLAADGLGLPRIVIGTGFECPPSTRPIPSLTPWAKVPIATLVDTEESVLAVINEVRSKFGLGALEQLSALFDVEDTMLCTFPALDPHSEHRGGDVRYWGPRLYAAGGETLKWPRQGERRIFGYIKMDYPGFKLVLDGLSATNHSVLLHVPHITAGVARRYQSPKLAISSKPLDLRKVANECDLALGHAGHGTTATLLLAGRPQLLLPSQVEQGMTAWRMASIGAAVSVYPGKRQPHIPNLIRKMLTSSGYAERAATAISDHAGFDPGLQVDEMTDHIERFLS